MFGRETAVLQRPQACLPTVRPQVSLEVYETLAGEIGYNPPGLLEERILRFLRVSGIKVYDLNEVDKYLTKIADRKIWVWRPLREKDVANWSLGDRGHGSYCCPGHQWYNYHRYGPYPHLVPIHVLRHVRKIETEFPSQVKFFVSDIVAHPDPFIMVAKRDVGPIVFGVWDEPDFGKLDE